MLKKMLALLFLCNISSTFRENNNLIIVIFLSTSSCYAQFVVNPSSRIVSYSNDKRLSWPLPVHPPSEKANDIW